MEENPRFKLVFAKLREAVEGEEVREETVEIRVHRTPEITREELDEIEELRRVVLDVTEPEPLSYTTT
jgi:hypothetical protein